MIKVEKPFYQRSPYCQPQEKKQAYTSDYWTFQAQPPSSLAPFRVSGTPPRVFSGGTHSVRTHTKAKNGSPCHCRENEIGIRQMYIYICMYIIYIYIHYHVSIVHMIHYHVLYT